MRLAGQGDEGSGKAERARKNGRSTTPGVQLYVWAVIETEREGISDGKKMEREREKEMRKSVVRRGELVSVRYNVYSTTDQTNERRIMAVGKFADVLLAADSELSVRTELL